jgi:hypothetical protein
LKPLSPGKQQDKLWEEVSEEGRRRERRREDILLLLLLYIPNFRLYPKKIR